MTLKPEFLLQILKIGHDTSMRGEGISLEHAIKRSKYTEIRNNLTPQDLEPIIVANPSLTKEWLLYSEDKRTSGGWYILESGKIGQVGKLETELVFKELPVAVAEYVIKELDFWVNK